MDQSMINGTDATGMIPPRLGMGAATAGVEDATGRFIFPLISLPLIIYFHEEVEFPS